jgi:hypothetical protein
MRVQKLYFDFREQRQPNNVKGLNFVTTRPNLPICDYESAWETIEIIDLCLG